MEARLDGFAPAACGRLGVCASVANLVRLKFLSADCLCPCGGVATARCGVGRRHWFFGVALARPPGVVLNAVPGVVLSAVPGPFDVDVRFALRAVTRPVLGNGTELVENRGQVRDALGIPHDVGVGLEVGKD